MLEPMEAAVLDQAKVVSVSAESKVAPAILSSLIQFVNEAYAKIKKGEAQERDFERLLTEALSYDDRVDLLSFRAYKTALGMYYSTKGRHPENKTSFVMIVESATPQKARIRVSSGISMEFKALREKEILTRNGVAHTSSVIHTHRDVRDSDVMKAAQALARKAMNSLRKSMPKRKRRRAA